jgi:ACR3 family arsenite efflux pump ArsB
LPISLYILHKTILETKEYDLFQLNKNDKLSKKVLNVLLNTFIVIIFSWVWCGFTFGFIDVLFSFKTDLTTGSLYLTPLFILVWLKSYSMKKKTKENDRQQI